MRRKPAKPTHDSRDHHHEEAAVVGVQNGEEAVHHIQPNYVGIILGVGRVDLFTQNTAGDHIPDRQKIQVRGYRQG